MASRCVALLCWPMQRRQQHPFRHFQQLLGLYAAGVLGDKCNWRTQGNVPWASADRTGCNQFWRLYHSIPVFSFSGVFIVSMPPKRGQGGALSFPGQLAVCFVVGFVGCALWHGVLNPTAEAQPAPERLLQSDLKAQLSQEPPVQACPPVVEAETTPCSCAGEQGKSNTVSAAEFAAYQNRLEREALECRDELEKNRKPRTEPTRSAVLARCALAWITKRGAELLDPKVPQTLFDYGYDGGEYPLPGLTSRDWLYLTSYLEDPSLVLPERRVLDANQVLMSLPSAFRITTLVTTNSLFDKQLILRGDDLVQAAEPLGMLDAYAKAISMARVSFVILPCEKGNLSRTPDHLVLRQAGELAESLGKEMGIHTLSLTVETLATFRYKGCVKELLKVEPVKIHRGVRLKWCYYPLGTKYDLIYRKGEMVQLVHRYVQQWTRFGGDKVKTVRNWHPSINMGDVLGWGLTRPQREVMFWDMLTQPSCPDPAIQNWLLSKGARVIRIDPNQQSWKNKHPVARSYVEFLRIALCVSPYGTGWKQVFDTTVQKTCMSCGGGQLIQSEEGGKYKFMMAQLHHRGGGDFPVMPLADAVASNEFPECPQCNACVMHTFRSLKLFWHNNKSLPPPACHQCYECQRRIKLDPGVPLGNSALESCSDVEGVQDNSAVNPQFCDDNQRRPLPRPSAPSDVRSKAPY
eukprot:TRINITY_DN23342_c0_g1_i1.p1 TRINITY_DN23342_c0_g1~~TRINITY_DN23342_c0_g1_i1.p1  ORF type:complete len:690 (-),score=104.18 TRINITY_DN23342_c0_g1_i1:40-2109(-)